MTEQRVVLHAQGPSTEPLHLVAEGWKDSGLIISVPEPHTSLAIVDEVRPIDNKEAGTVRPGVVELGSYYPTLEMSNDRKEIMLRFRKVTGDPPEIAPGRIEALERALAEVVAWACEQGCAPRRGLGTYGDAYRDAKEDMVRRLVEVLPSLRKPPCGICVSCVAVNSCALPVRVVGEEVGKCAVYLGPLLQNE